MTTIGNGETILDNSVRRPFAFCGSFVAKLLNRIQARRRLQVYQSLDRRFAKDIGQSPETLDWQCARSPSHEIEKS